MKGIIGVLLLALCWLHQAEPRFIVLPASTAPEKLYKEAHQADDLDIVVLGENPSLEKLEKSYQNPKIWMTAEGDVSFYAGLFKQIKLEDVYEGRALVVLKELAGPHAMGESKSTRKSGYAPAKSVVKPKIENKNADLVVFSFDRPLQLYAFLESAEKFVKGLGQISVIYRCSGDQFQQGYDKVQKCFKQVKFLAQGKDPAKDRSRG